MGNNDNISLLSWFDFFLSSYSGLTGKSFPSLSPSGLTRGSSQPKEKAPERAFSEETQ